MCQRRVTWWHVTCGVVLGLCLNLLALAGVLWAQAPAEGNSADVTDDVEVIQVLPQQVKADAAGALRLQMQFPEGYHLNPRAPLDYRIAVQGEGLRIAEAERQQQVIAPSLPLVIPFQVSAGTHQVTAAVDVTFYYCREDDTGICVIQSIRWQVPLQIGPEHQMTEVNLTYKAEVPIVQKQL